MKERMERYERSHPLHKKLILDESLLEDFVPVVVGEADLSGDFDFVGTDLELNTSEPEEENLAAPSAGIDSAIATLINKLIVDEWEAIQGYNDAIVSLQEEHADEDILAIFTDIVNEEHVHVGQLQKALEKVAPDAAKIKEGEKEGEEQLETDNSNA